MIGSARFGLWRVVGLEGLVMGLGLGMLPLFGGLFTGGCMGTKDRGSGGTCGKGRPWGRTRLENDGGWWDDMADGLATEMGSLMVSSVENSGKEPDEWELEREEGTKTVGPGNAT